MGTRSLLDMLSRGPFTVTFDSERGRKTMTQSEFLYSGEDGERVVEYFRFFTGVSSRPLAAECSDQ